MDICEMKDKLIDIVGSVLSVDLDKICTAELGEAVDMIKDIAEIQYYDAVTLAMHNTKEPEHYMNKYIPGAHFDEPKNEMSFDDIMRRLSEIMNNLPKDEKIVHKQRLSAYVNNI